MAVAKRQWIVLTVFIVVTVAGGAAGSLFTVSSIPTWYSGIAKPSWTPPNGVFGPVWTTLYFMIGIAGWFASRLNRKNLLGIWIVQLTLNFLWTPLFFGAHELGWALADILALWLVIGWFVAVAWKQARSAAILFLPYWAWVSYATALTYAIWTLNPSVR